MLSRHWTYFHISTTSKTLTSSFRYLNSAETLKDTTGTQGKIYWCTFPYWHCSGLCSEFARNFWHSSRCPGFEKDSMDWYKLDYLYFSWTRSICPPNKSQIWSQQFESAALKLGKSTSISYLDNSYSLFTDLHSSLLSCIQLSSTWNKS